MGRESRVNQESRGGLPPGSFILDRYGRPITAGCEMALLQPTVANIFVQAIEPAVQMDPRQQPIPPGMVKITGVAHFSWLAPKGVPQREFLLARGVEELVAAGVLRERPQGVETGEDGVQVPQVEEEGANTMAPPTGPRLIVPPDARD